MLRHSCGYFSLSVDTRDQLLMLVQSRQAHERWKLQIQYSVIKGRLCHSVALHYNRGLFSCTIVSAKLHYKGYRKGQTSRTVLKGSCLRKVSLQMSFQYIDKLLILVKQHYEIRLVDLPTLSTPYLWPATWCDSGTQPFRWVWPWGPWGPWALWPHFSSAGGPSECRWARLTLTAAEHGFSSSLPRAREDSITTWRCPDMEATVSDPGEFSFKIIYDGTLFFLYSTIYVTTRRTQFAWARYVIGIQRRRNGPGSLHVAEPIWSLWAGEPEKLKVADFIPSAEAWIHPGSIPHT